MKSSTMLAMLQRLGTVASLSRPSVRHTRIVLRSVLRFANEKGYPGAIPSALRRLKQPEPSILEIPSDEQVEEILDSPAHRDGARSRSG